MDILREHYNFSETDPSTHEQTRKLRAELFKIMKVFMKADKQVRGKGNRGNEKEEKGKEGRKKGK